MTAKSWLPLDEDAAREFFAEMKEKGVKSVAISSVFSTVRDEHENARQRFAEKLWGKMYIYQYRVK